MMTVKILESGSDVLSPEMEAPHRTSFQRVDGPSLRGAAPRGESVPATWTTGAKDGIGTSFYEPEMGESLSNVWFTLSRGTLTEVYYPDVSCANLRELQWAITDGKSFTDMEETDTTHCVELVRADALLYKQVNTARNGKYRIEKTYVTNPNRHALMIQMTFHALLGNATDYSQFIYINPHMNNGGGEVNAEVVEYAGRNYLVTTCGDKAMAVATAGRFAKASAGYVGQSDGLSELKQTFDIASLHAYAVNGNVTQIANAAGDPLDNGTTRTIIAIGFGETAGQAIETAQGALDDEFEQVLARYQAGWQGYLRRLKPAPIGSKEQYNVAAMVLKAHEDKCHPGAVVASLTIPWGDKIISTAGGIGGYHLVWSRDFYHVASTMTIVGDVAFAKRSLEYLDKVQQRSDGSFPQNSWLDGTPYWPGLQMDQVAYPILLADQLGEHSRYESLVKPAADFIVDHGPATPQERWEENAGYSPSTLAAEIAGLVVAAKLARQAGDFAAAGRYLWKADEWARNVDAWTVVQGGSLASQPYYMRISDTRHPADNHWIEIRNGGGWHSKWDIVDAGFLELVRLGIKAPDDSVVTHSLDVIDEILRYDAPYGPVWRRYNKDGYGEHADGSPYNGQGIGRPWPFLSGERGEYEVALAASERRTVPSHVYGAEKLLSTLAGAANQGYLIPEQVWDGEAVPAWHLEPGVGTGSATPLAWAMAQYIRLCHCIAEGRIIEMPEEVANRYIMTPPGIGPTVQVDSPDFGVVLETSVATVCGRTTPGTTVLLIGREDTVQTVGGSDGRFTAEIRLWATGENVIDVIGYDNDRQVSSLKWSVHYEPQAVFEMSDPVGDDDGPGCYTYPTHPDFRLGDFDLEHVRMMVDETYIYWEISFGNLDNPWEGPSGLSKQLIDIYLHIPHLNEPVSLDTRGMRARFVDGSGWHRLVRVTGNWRGGDGVFQADGTRLGTSMVQAHGARRSVCIRTSKQLIGGHPEANWRMLIAVAGEENGQPRAIRVTRGEWDFGGGDDTSRHPFILDLFVPPGYSQKEILDWRTKDDLVRLPMIQLGSE